jgi:Ni,Fe-hydrogenase III component G
MNDLDTIERIKGALGSRIVEMTNPAPGRIFMTVAVEDLVSVMTNLKRDLGFWYLATISGFDKGDAFQILYHFGLEGGNLNVRTQIPKPAGPDGASADKTAPHLPSICAVIPGAILYERELQDMFGIVVDNIPDPRRVVLPDDWPEQNFPLRKDWKFERPPEVIPGGKK